MTLREFRPSAAVPVIADVPQQHAVRLAGVSKTYKLYDSPRSQLLDQSGLYKLAFWKRAPSFQEFHALHGVDLTVAKGERLGIVGRNGAGKSTLLKLVSGNFLATKGVVQVNGTVQALITLGTGFHPDVSGYENIRAALMYNGLKGNEFEEALADVIDFVELDDFLHQPLKTYSLGMHARLLFAAATAIKPDILIIDEVIGAGDGYFTAKSSIRMDRLCRSGCTLLLVSHSWQLIQQYCDRVIWIREGRVFMDGAPPRVLAAYEAHIAEDTAKLKEVVIEPTSQVESQADNHAGSSNDLEYETASNVAPLEADSQSSTDIPNAGSDLNGEQRVSERGELETGCAVMERPSPSGANAGTLMSSRDYAAVSWIAARIREQEGTEAGDEFEDRLDNGHRVYRIPGIPGLRFSYIAVMSNGSAVFEAETGQPLTIEFKLVADRTDTFTCSYWIHFFGIDGRRLCRVQSPVDSFRLTQGQKRHVRVDMDPLILGANDYLISFSVFDHSKSESTYDTAATRFEMLARSYQLKVRLINDSDPPVLHYPGNWLFGNSGQSQQSILSSQL